MSREFARFEEIREQYARRLPEWLASYEATGHMFHDPYFMDWHMSPIEELVWGDIRGAGLPFFPQLPVLTYFIDFGCPMLKIGIECDGKAWHDSRRDQIRDSQLAAQGWTLFRIEGHECRRFLALPWDCDPEEAAREHTAKWFSTTSEGVIHAIKAAYFRDEFDPFDAEHQDLIATTLFEHKSTPLSHPPRPLKPKSTGPILAREMLRGYMEVLRRRARNAA